MNRLASMALTVILTAATFFSMHAGDTTTRDTSVLPAPAAEMLGKHFADTPVSFIKIDRELGRVSEYDVVLSDGTEVNFGRDGRWKEVETSRRGHVPEALVPEAISEYLSHHVPASRIVGLERHRKGYDVELSNGVEMKFDSKARFLRYDD